MKYLYLIIVLKILSPATAALLTPQSDPRETTREGGIGDDRKKSDVSLQQAARNEPTSYEDAFYTPRHIRLCGYTQYPGAYFCLIPTSNAQAPSETRMRTSLKLIFAVLRLVYIHVPEVMDCKRW